MEVMRLLMDSDTVCECPARMDQVGGSFGLMASERAVLINEAELSNMVLAEVRMGSCAREPWEITQREDIRCYYGSNSQWKTKAVPKLRLK